MITGVHSPAVFGQFNGEDVHQVTLGRTGSLQAHIITWGAVVRNLTLPLAGGGLLPLTLGFETFDPYPHHSPYFGAVVGRYANRIAGGHYSLGGKTFDLDRNEAGQTTLHGGSNGFSQRMWQIADLTENSVTLKLASHDGEAGFPGNASITCTYSIEQNMQLQVLFSAETDAATPLNLAQHSYFNLDGGRDISNHSLQIFADAFTPVDAFGVPTGLIQTVEHTIFDFRKSQSLALAHNSIDHNFVLSNQPQMTGKLRQAARLASEKSGISMLVETTKPGLQFYDGHKINVAVPGHGGRPYAARAGLCLETQFFPDSPNQPQFPDSILWPGARYEHRTLFSFNH